MDWRSIITRPAATGTATLAVAATALVLGAPASASAATGLPSASGDCATPTFSQPFLSLTDPNFYTLIPGQTPDSFNGAGWTLSGGARIVMTQLADRTTATVLDLPSGSKAVSPVMCVTSQFPVARTVIRDVVGSEGVFFYVSYLGTNTANTPKNTGQVHGQQTNWTVSDPVNLQPNNTAGWQQVRFTLVPGGKTSDFQLYNFYVDPRCA